LGIFFSFFGLRRPISISAPNRVARETGTSLPS
jgi:hypothetical protein